jgi:HD superfamily phosphohydrolase
VIFFINRLYLPPEDTTALGNSSKLKIFNDPIYGFIGVPSSFFFELIDHRYFQRLRRISQMGLSYLVYPGAHHTRFQHALGCLHLMQKAVSILRYKGVEITEDEEEALMIAILLHDIGHGPFSHALEFSLAGKRTHESISLEFMEKLNEEFKGRFSRAIAIFQGLYPKSFLNQLVSSQLDMDRLDYLKRDSFYSGVAEGNINSERLISMLNVADGQLVIEEKGLYSVEKFLMARRFMYWQVYLHKTSLVAELVLNRIMDRARQLLHQGISVGGSSVLLRFLDTTYNTVDRTEFLDTYAQLDDTDIMMSLKIWQHHEDLVLSRLSHMILHRKLPYIRFRNKPMKTEKIEERKAKLALQWPFDQALLDYFIFSGEVSNEAYSLGTSQIRILTKSGEVVDLPRMSQFFGHKEQLLAQSQYYVAYPKKGV